MRHAGRATPERHARISRASAAILVRGSKGRNAAEGTAEDSAGVTAADGRIAGIAEATAAETAGAEGLSAAAAGTAMGRIVGITADTRRSGVRS